MSNIQPLNVSRHRGVRWRRPSDYGFTAGQNFAPLSKEEVAQAALSFPLAFVAQQGRWSLGAILGPLPGQNLYVAPNGTWIPSYVPAQFRLFPFQIGWTPERTATLCVDEDSGLLGDQGEPILTETGDLSASVSEIWSAMQEMSGGVTALLDAAAMLANVEVLEPWPLVVQTGGGERTVSGLFRVSEAALNALSGADYVKLRDSGVLGVAYAQIVSMGNLPDLGKLLHIHAQTDASVDQTGGTSSFDATNNTTIDWSKVGQ